MHALRNAAAAAILVALSACTHDARVQTKEVVTNPLHPLSAHHVAQTICGNAAKADFAVDLTIHGRITKIAEQRMCDNERRMVQVEVDDAGKERTVYLAPVEYLAARRIRLAVGDQVVIHASRLAKDDSVIVAQSVASGDKTTTLRDRTGRAMWSKTAH